VPWTPPKTDFSPGNVLTAAQMNGIGSNLTALRGDYGRTQYTTAARSINSVTWVDLGGPGDITLAASAGDVVEVAFSALAGNQATDIFLDTVTVVSGSPVNAFGNATTPSNSHQGILAWASVGGFYNFIGGNYFYTLVAGDVSGGNVLLRMRARTAAGIARDIAGSANQPQTFFARNHGPVEI
jgi:hypothetical protein